MWRTSSFLVIPIHVNTTLNIVRDELREPVNLLSGVNKSMDVCMCIWSIRITNSSQTPR